MIKNIIFDIDRTLIDSFSIEQVTLKQALYEFTNKYYPDEIMHQAITLPTREFFKLVNIEPDSDIHHKLLHRWGELLEEHPIPFFTNIKEILHKLHENGYKLYLITSRTQEEYHELDDIMKDIYPLFSDLVTSDMVVNHKPYPDSFNYLADKYNLKKEESIYIGDAKSDMLFAKNANIKFAHAKWDSKENLDADYILEKPNDLLTIFLAK